MEIVLSIMKNEGYDEIVPDPESAEIIFINTCAIRDNAEQKVWQRLNYFWFLKRQWKANVAAGRSRSLRPPKIAVLGCMAERLKEKILDSDKMVDVVCGPDAYRDLPRLLQEVDYGQKGINTLLSLEETMREKTHAHRNYVDDVPDDVKQRRLAELINTFRETTAKIYDSQVGTVQVVLVEGPNKRAPETEMIGKTDRGHRVSFVSVPVPHTFKGDEVRKPVVGDFIEVKITKSSTASLFGDVISRTSLSRFYKNHSSEAHAVAA
ncbi:hypothetical protein E2562_003667 [Oryza meyeriana var. granulata]|uniref:TRAM domain-containing protein n=1 Tax=Oryza meyeriana var. granulata TaxID=110450 RepID=A0A6G1C5F7_9ORYZ|nr:hypothetical protein E2562_003667 [Oryza meyeriana var. granulata]